MTKPQMLAQPTAVQTDDFVCVRTELLGWFTAQAMPLWSTAGTDWTLGGFVEKLDHHGLPVAEPRRTRVVARQLYVFSVARKLGWATDPTPWIDHGLAFLFERLHQPDGTFAAGVSPEGILLNPRFDLYEQAFALFAMASVHRFDAARYAHLPAQAHALMDVLEAGWRHPQRGFEEARPRALPLLSNPHMHLFEAVLQWAEATPHDAGRWLALADELGELALHHLIEPVSGLVTERFDGDWQPVVGVDGQRVEPGHQFEWGWLLNRWGTLRQRPEALNAARRMIDLAEAHGVCPQRGVAINELLCNLSMHDADAKLWPQTERIKAWVGQVALAQQAGDASAQAQAQAHATRAMQGLQAYLGHPLSGGWEEVWRADGQWQPEPVRASSLYHIVCALESLA
jgi:mannose/cellobiose epimerase-like protein (N-acyl-D-glucosamine 2-epimerase family)